MKKIEPIDFVVTWVDDRDPEWRKERAKYSKNRGTDNRDERYRDWDFLKYWFRGVEKYAPWVRKIHFVTWGHVPAWLDTSNPKLHIVKHEDYISKEYLPLFNSNAIEMCMQKIEGLTEKFVYFNDDFFCISPLKDTDFFIDGKARDMLAFQPIIANPTNPVMSHTMMNNSLVLARHFDKWENVRKQPGAYFKLGYPLKYFGYNFLELVFPRFTGFYTVHGPFPFTKSIFREVWEKEEEELKETMNHRFRSKDDVTIYLMREWQKLNGYFVPRNVHKDLGYFEAGRDDVIIADTIKKQKKKFICINDTGSTDDFDKSKEMLQRAFLKILPEKSSFEK